MVVVLFEVTIAPGQRDAYLGMAKGLLGELEKQEGFISVERFESLHDTTKLLSFQIWRDEASVAAWREHALHRKTMPIGYQKLFSDYRLTVLSVLRQYGKDDREQSPTSLATLQASQTV